jgi:hypothetical protein
MESHRKTAHDIYMGTMGNDQITCREAQLSLAIRIEEWLRALNMRLNKLHTEVRDLERLRLLIAAQAVGRAESGVSIDTAMKNMLIAVNAWDHASEGPRSMRLV